MRFHKIIIKPLLWIEVLSIWNKCPIFENVVSFRNLSPVHRNSHGEGEIRAPPHTLYYTNKSLLCR